MPKLFGTDGIRGIAGSNDLNIFTAAKVGSATTRVLKLDHQPTFIIGTDTRISCKELKYALIYGIMQEGGNVLDADVIPTPAVSYLITKNKVDGGFVISASHNPAKYNGIKVFNKDGMKLPDEIEEKIEDIMLNNFTFNLNNTSLGTYQYLEKAKDEYVDYLLSTIDKDVKFDNLNIAIDTASGAASETAKMLFDKTNFNYHLINNHPNGLNINDNSGSTHLEGLIEYVKNNNMDIGIAFDGDADRCLLIDHMGNIVDGDKIMAIYGNYLKNNNQLTNNTIVGTVMSNLGLRKFCDQNNINFIATKVGDRYVLENMLENNYIVGGEQSGHIILRNFANTGDGELTAITILSIMKKSQKTLQELASIMTTYPQILLNLEVNKDGKETYSQNENIQNVIKKIEDLLNDDGRVLIRPSGTENLIRIMIEGKNKDEITNYCQEIYNVMDKELNHIKK